MIFNHHTIHDYYIPVLKYTIRNLFNTGRRVCRQTVRYESNFNQSYLIAQNTVEHWLNHSGIFLNLQNTRVVWSGVFCRKGGVSIELYLYILNKYHILIIWITWLTPYKQLPQEHPKKFCVKSCDSHVNHNWLANLYLSYVTFILEKNLCLLWSFQVRGFVNIGH